MNQYIYVLGGDWDPTDDNFTTAMPCSSGACVCVCVQLHTSRQLAVIIVHTHPWVPCKHHLLEELARQQQQAPVAQILESAETDSIEHSADWEEIVTYLQTITPENLHQYIPLGRSQSPGPLGSSPDLDDADLGLAEEILSVLS